MIKSINWNNKFLRFLAAAVFIANGFIAVDAKAADPANLIPNPSFETSATSGLPDNWSQGGWGSNIAVFTYPAQNAYDGQNAATVEITQYTDGDAKWYFNPIAVTPGVYQFSDYYKSNITSYLVAQYSSGTGVFSYTGLATLQPSADWKNASVKITVPSGTTQITIFHVIQAVGSLSTDNFSLASYVPPAIPQPPAPTASNLVLNPSLEYADENGMPIGWLKAGWGTNQAALTYPVQGYNGGKAAKVEISSYTDGDAKWYFSPITAKSNYRYIFSDYYQSSIQSVVTAQIQLTDNTYQYIRLGTPAAATDWTKFTATFSVPGSAKSITVFHLIEAIGTLAVDEYALTENGDTSLSKGMVSIDFDDGWLSAYKSGLPIFNFAGLKTTQNIFTEGFDDPTNYVSVNQAKMMQLLGNEIGSHGATHTDLTTIADPVELAKEISGAKAFLSSKGIKTATFAYPFGKYNASIQSMIKSAGFIGARSSDIGFNDKYADKYALKIQAVENTTTFDQIKAWIDSAKKDKKWLILLFHEVLNNTSGREYSTTPKILSQVAAYLSLQRISVVTNSQGIGFLGQ